MQKLKVGIIGATGMVGQRFIMLLAEHPYFEITALVAGPRSAGKKYGKAVLAKSLHPGADMISGVATSTILSPPNRELTASALSN